MGDKNNAPQAAQNIDEQMRSEGIYDPGGRDITDRNFDSPDGGPRPPAATDVDEETSDASSLGAEGTPRTGEPPANH